MPNAMLAERERRRGQTVDIVRHLLAHPGEWIPAFELAQLSRSLAVHSRIVEARELVALDGYELPWNGENGSESAYMLRPKQLGRDAAEPAAQTWTSGGPFTPEFELKP